MKKILYAGISMGLVMALSACGGNPDVPDASPESQATEQPAEVAETPATEAEWEKDDEPGNTEEVLGKFLDMLGKTDAETVDIMDGEQNIAEDGTLIGRIYEVELFDEKVTAGTLCDMEQRVTIVTMQLENPEAGIYEEALTELWGPPEEQSAAESETGSTWVAWNKDNKEIRLYQSYGIVSLEFQLFSDVSESGSTDDTDELFTGWLPEDVKQEFSETEPNEQLRQTIIDHYQIPEDAWESTKYYYNYVDLDVDGKEEIIAVVIGSYTSGSGGDSALLLSETDGKLAVEQAFTLVNTPIIIAEDGTSGLTSDKKVLILKRSGGGAEAEIVGLSSSDGVYTSVSDAAVIENLDIVKGTAILCNNLIHDMESGNYLTLEAQETGGDKRDYWK